MISLIGEEDLSKSSIIDKRILVKDKLSSLTANMNPFFS